VDASQKCAGSGYPAVLANVYSSKTKKPLVQPYAVLERTMVAKGSDGKEVKLPIKIGVIGFTTPGIMNWDKRYLEGKVYTEARWRLPANTCQSCAPRAPMWWWRCCMAVWTARPIRPPWRTPACICPRWRASMPWSWAISTACSPICRPSLPTAKAVWTTRLAPSTACLRSWPAPGARRWVIQLPLQWDGKKWSVAKTGSKSELRNIQNKDAAGATVFVDADPAVAPLIEAQHQAAISYVKTPIGSTDFRMSTLFADVGDPGAIQIVNQAQQAYVANYIKTNLPQYASLPVLSVSAPFKSGFQGGKDFTDVAARWPSTTRPTCTCIRTPCTR
jgi:2',3'-cyclic-nucleotide 2'-phosphodiesterase/3'-nucleotidase